MVHSASTVLAGILSIYAISSGAFSQCSVDVVFVNGRVEGAPHKGVVRVQVVYPKQKQKLGESGEVTVEDGSFRPQIPFLTQSHAPVCSAASWKSVNGSRDYRCFPMEADREDDRVSLDLAKDFKMVDARAYALRSEILLHSPPGTSPIQ